MDHGTLTDSNGKKIDFRHVILLMTSNVGAREMASRAPGFAGGSSEKVGEGERALERMFSPEFRNRLDARLQFKALDPGVMSRIVQKFIDELSAQLKPQKVRLKLTEAGLGWLAEKGYDPKFGARPLGRLIDEEIKQPLTDALLFGSLQNGGSLTIDAVGGEIRLEMAGPA
jgi:ATP-dependent Clp protease ATP-binding subunit ClpA